MYRSNLDLDDKNRSKIYFLWRLELYRIQPTFPQDDGELAHMPCDEEILVREVTSVGIDHLECDTIESVLKMSL